MTIRAAAPVLVERRVRKTGSRGVWTSFLCFSERRCYSNRDDHRSDTMVLLRLLLIETTAPANSKSGPHPIFTAGHLSSLENIISCSTVVGLLACQWKIVDPLNGTSVRRSLAPRKKSTLIHSPFAKIEKLPDGVNHFYIA